LKRSKEFAEYFKKIISNQKINNDPNSYLAKEKGLDLLDFAHLKSIKKLRFLLSLVLTIWIEV
jgi:hypothetical protein